MKFSIKDFSSKCDQIRRKLLIWSHLLEKSLMENFIFCAVTWKTENLKNATRIFKMYLKNGKREILKLCFKDYILRNYYFLAKVTFNLTWKSPRASLYGWISKPCRVVYAVCKEYQQQLPLHSISWAAHNLPMFHIIQYSSNL